MGTLRDKLNPLYAHLFAPGVFDRPEIEETRATCDNCAMCDHGQVAPVAMDYFEPSAKCCTYYPTLANYLVGGILADTSEELAEGRRRIREKIASRVNVTPLFVGAPRKYTLLYTAARGSGAFGRSKALQCPYFDADNGGRCTVWQYREAVCSTYFCKYTNGKPGFDFWDTLKSYLSHVERMLARSLMTSIDKDLVVPALPPHELTIEELEDRPPSAADYERWWGKWVGREEEFYITCFERARAVTPKDFADHVDDAPEGRRCNAELAARYDAINAQTVLPSRLVLATGMRTRTAGDSVVVTSYNPYDGFSIEKELFDVLGKLDGAQTLEQNLARLDKEEDIQLAPELLQYLFTHGVIGEPDAAKAA
ncbi:MAG TPA: hypothetical protein VLT33_47470, partial [Labilithrix sp.]|nr:hypothetical protein [Labilithrix sp.]